MGDKALNQLEKSISSKLEAIVARQISKLFRLAASGEHQQYLLKLFLHSPLPFFISAVQLGFHATFMLMIASPSC